MMPERKLINAVVKTWLCTLLSGSLLYGLIDSQLADYLYILYVSVLLSIPGLPLVFFLFKRILGSPLSARSKRWFCYMLFPLYGCLCLLVATVAVKEAQFYFVLQQSWRVLPFVLCGILWFEVFCRKLLSGALLQSRQ